MWFAHMRVSVFPYMCNRLSNQSDLSVLAALTYQVWTGTSASGTSSPAPSAAARWRWCGCGAASSGAACCAPYPTRCWCWAASGWATARSLADAAARPRAGARLPRPETTPGGGGGAAAWSLRGGGRHVVTRSLEEQRRCVRWQKQNNAIKVQRSFYWALMCLSITPVVPLSTACNCLDRFIFNCAVFAMKSVLLLTSSM